MSPSVELPGGIAVPVATLAEHIDPDQVARILADWNSEQQAECLNSLGAIATAEWNASTAGRFGNQTTREDSQWCWIAQRLNKAGKHLLGRLAEFAEVPR